MRNRLLIKLSLHQAYLTHKRISSSIQGVDLGRTTNTQVMTTHKYQQILRLLLAYCACLILLHRYCYQLSSKINYEIEKVLKTYSVFMETQKYQKIIKFYEGFLLNSTEKTVWMVYKFIENKKYSNNSFKIVMTDSAESEGLKQYVTQLFAQYDTQHKGKLNFQQITKFFSDLMKSVGVDVTYTLQQLYEVIFMAKPGFNGQATPDDVYEIFKVMLNYSKKPIEPTSQLNYANFQQYQQMQPQYLNQYIQMQGQQPQYTAYNNFVGQNGYTAYNGQNGQMWYPNYMGVNPYGYRQ